MDLLPVCYSNSSEFADPICFRSLLRSRGLLCDTVLVRPAGV